MHTWSIRGKLVFGLGLVLLMLGILSSSAMYGLYSFRSISKQINDIQEELSGALRLWTDVVAVLDAMNEEATDPLPLASGTGVPPVSPGLTTPNSDTTGTRGTSGTGVPPVSGPQPTAPPPASASERARERALSHLHNALDELTAYQRLLDDPNRTRPADRAPLERRLTAAIGIQLSTLRQTLEQPAFTTAPDDLQLVRAHGQQLQGLLAQLTQHLSAEVDRLHGTARGVWRSTITLSWASTGLVVLLLLGLVRLCYLWIFLPIRQLHKGSRRVAEGNFDYRIRLDTKDEMNELAQAFNHMTARFQAIHRDLDEQVRQRSQQLVRSERLASVGFLAAGVAHEINNPLATIAMCSESLQGRLEAQVSKLNGDAEVFRKFLRMIQDEAFRCKSITEKLLDFSRMGEVQRQDADLTELIQSVIDMMQHLGRYRRKEIVFNPPGPMIASVNPQEIKQVVLNLVVNALDSMEAGGRLTIEISGNRRQVEMRFIDTGCGMTPDVLENIFEPFFTRRRVGQGTGLGLSISHRIVSQHGGEIEATSPGPDQGSTFVVRLPRHETKVESRVSKVEGPSRLERRGTRVAHHPAAHVPPLQTRNAGAAAAPPANHAPPHQPAALNAQSSTLDAKEAAA